MTNPKTTWTGIASAVTAALTTLAALPYTLGDVATWIPPEWKPWVFKVGLVATVALRVLKSVNTADAPPAPSSAAQAILEPQSNVLK